MKKLILLVLTLISFCASSQSVKERNDARIIKKIENAKICSIALISFCVDEDYDAFYGGQRKLGEMVYGKGENCCLKYPKYPFISPMEVHLAAFENEKEIRKYAANPFQLKKVRAKLKPRINKLIEKAKEQGHEDLPFYTDQGFTIKDYDFDKKELVLKNYYGQSISFRGDTKGNFSEDFKLTKSIAGDYRIPISEKKAEKLFSYYDKYPMLNKTLFVKLSYTISATDRKGNYGKFTATVSKMEFFYPDNWDDKIGEITVE
ncbi:DUF4852 domain-containing protein [Winogradskyella sp. PE311]|uniref:DUF4852 domain-containing protein n=1 Tax=Winogradskyella sp. PE311 TaxID=3366943 RepID=UPI00397F5F8A